jgi:hypothetical protein
MDNLIGKHFQKLSVIKEGKKTDKGVKRWECLCSCGNTVLVTRYNLTHGISKSCGCWNREHNLIGKKFGRLIVIEKIPERKNKRIYWKCRCTCGKETIVKGNNLITGTTSSCGCYKNEIFEKNRKIIGGSENRGKINEIERLEVNKINKYNKYKKDARYRGLIFTLDFDFFVDCILKPCQYCGTPPNPFNGIDRIDNTIGYKKENCVPCCSFCNSAKKNLPLKDFLNWAVKASQNLKSF